MADRDSLSRVVFSCLIEEGTTWSDCDSLQVGFGTDAQGEPIHVVLYRLLGGSIYDLSNLVTVSSTGAGAYSVSLPRGTTVSQPLPKLRLGFTAQVTSYPSTAVFTGTIAVQSWKGYQCGTDTLPLNSVLAPPDAILDDVQKFLAISPLVTTGGIVFDQALQWATYIFQDILLHSYSAQGEKDFFPSLGDLGSVFSSKAKPPNQPPSSGPFSLAQISAANNSTLFRISGIHLICTALKSASWLDENYRGATKDLSAQFFAMLTATDRNLQYTETVYGVDMPLVKNRSIPILRQDYRDVSTRCYLAAFACMFPELVNYTPDTASAMYSELTKTLTSDSYKAHHVMAGTSGASDPRAQMLTVNLGIVHDKLIMLKILEGYTIADTADWATVVKEITDTLTQLDTAAMNTGLFGVTNVRLPHKTFKLDLPVSDIISDEDLEDLHDRDNIEQGGAAGRNGTPGFDYRSNEADKYLVDEAQALGLFSDVAPSSPTCVIL